jgi:GDP/UDP-N,N'-diacetylbacillosamine 2-epimerase (hydrolysing)
MKRVAVVVSARPSWAKLQTVVELLRHDDEIEIDLIACAYALIHRFGRVADVMRESGLAPTTEIHSAVDGNTLDTSVQTMGLTALHVSEHFKRSRPDCVVMVADRHETLALAASASYQNIPLVHLQGGEQSGNIDHKVRWANSMLADWHAASTFRAREALLKAGLPRNRVWWTGCPSIDLCRAAQDDPPVTASELCGVGDPIDPLSPFTIVMVHPETEHPESGPDRLMEAIGVALHEHAPTIVFWPGPDAEQEVMAKMLRKWHEDGPAMQPVHLVRTFPPRRFLRLLGQATLAVGNSSAFVREASILNTRVVLVGDRQRNRERRDGYTYGDGFAAARIVGMIYRAAGVVGENSGTSLDIDGGLTVEYLPPKAFARRNAERGLA